MELLLIGRDGIHLLQRIHWQGLCVIRTTVWTKDGWQSVAGFVLTRFTVWTLPPFKKCTKSICFLSSLQWKTKPTVTSSSSVRCLCEQIWRISARELTMCFMSDSAMLLWQAWASCLGMGRISLSGKKKTSFVSVVLTVFALGLLTANQSPYYYVKAHFISQWRYCGLLDIHSAFLSKSHGIDQKIASPAWHGTASFSICNFHCWMKALSDILAQGVLQMEPLVRLFIQPCLLFLVVGHAGCLTWLKRNALSTKTTCRSPKQICSSGLLTRWLKLKRNSKQRKKR